MSDKHFSGEPQASVTQITQFVSLGEPVFDMIVRCEVEGQFTDFIGHLKALLEGEADESA